jgi:hypothetical protein
MRIALCALTALTLAVATAQAGDCRRAVVVEQVVVQDNYHAPIVQKVVAQPVYVQRVVAQPVYVQQVVAQKVVRQNVYGGGGFRQAQFVGGGRQRLGIGGGGGGGFIAGTLDAVGRLANSPAGTFALGVLAGRGF